MKTILNEKESPLKEKGLTIPEPKQREGQRGFTIPEPKPVTKPIKK